MDIFQRGGWVLRLQISLTALSLDALHSTPQTLAERLFLSWGDASRARLVPLSSQPHPQQQQQQQQRQPQHQGHTIDAEQEQERRRERRERKEIEESAPQLTPTQVEA